MTDSTDLTPGTKVTPAEGTIFTPNLNLAKQPTGAQNWGQVLNDNFDILDEAASQGGGLEIGDIGFAPLGIDETQNKRRYLNGQVISQTQFASFTAKVKAAIALYPALSATETNWQAEVTNSKLGQCGKFVIDDTAGTIRLPKVVNINGLQNLVNLGGIKAESLPNITGDVHPTDDSGFLYTNGTADGAFTQGSIVGVKGLNIAASGSYRSLKFNAALSSVAYQDGAPVQQEAVQYPYFIQVATGSEESVDVSTEIQLNNPFFFGMSQWFESEPNNASWLISNGSYHSGATYVDFYEWLLKIHNGTLTVDGVSVKAYGASGITDYDYVINTANTTFRLPLRTSDDFVVECYDDGNGNWYRVYNSGWVEQGGINYDQKTNPTTISLHKEMANTMYTRLCNAFTESANGTTVDTRNTTTTTFQVVKISPLLYTMWRVAGQGAESPQSKIYFYVGETIQDANVVAAAGVLTDIANLKGYDYVVESYRNGTEWYRIYKSGWVEQGGRRTDVSAAGVTVTLLKPFIDVDYTVTLSIHGKYETPLGAGNRNEASFVLWGHNYTNGVVDWVACGQGE